MKTRQNRSHEGDELTRPASGPGHAARSAGRTAAFADNRGVAAAQRQLAAGIQQSDLLLAQRALGEGMHRSPAMAARHGAVAAAAPNHTGLPDRLKAGVESLSGVSMADVTVHYNSARPAQMQAHAFAQGTQIHVAPGQERHVAHEAWHVVQQKQGRVQATAQANGTAINDDPQLEREADVQGARALAHGGASVQLRLAVGRGHAASMPAWSGLQAKAVIQRDAFWAWPLTSAVPTTAAPDGAYRQRVGGTNHRLYETAGAARNAAKEVLNLSFEEIRYSFQVTRPGADPAGGTYTYYPDPDQKQKKTKVLVNHDADPHASIQTSDGVVTNSVNHFHAGVIADRTVTRHTENPTDIEYVKHPNAAEHYFNL
jgi:hypothetical protein